MEKPYGGQELGMEQQGGGRSGEMIGDGVGAEDLPESQ